MIAQPQEATTSLAGRILKGSLSLALAGFVSRTASFVASLLLVRLLGQERLGTFALLTSWVQMASTFSTFSLGTAAAKFVAQTYKDDPERAGGIIRVLCLLGMILAALVAVAFSLFEPYLASRYLKAGHFTGDTLLASAWIILLTISNIGTGVLYGFQEFRCFARINAVIGLASLPLTLILVTAWRLPGAVWASVVLAALQSTLILRFCYLAARDRHIALAFRLPWRRDDVRQVLQFALAAFVGEAVVNPVPALAMTYLASRPGGISQVGLVSACNRLIALLGFLPATLASTLIPALAQVRESRSEAGFAQAIALAARMLWLLILPLAVFFWIAGRRILFLLYGSGYQTAWLILFLLVAVALLTAINEASDRSLVAAGRVWLSTANNAGFALLFLVGTAVLVPHYRGLGYALAYLVSYATYVAIQASWMKRLFHLELRQFGSLALATGLLALVCLGFAARVDGASALGLGVTFSFLVVCLEWKLLFVVGEREEVLRVVRRRLKALRLIGPLFGAKGLA
jgi:O-antigen/teichoic acid export membrane protein